MVHTLFNVLGTILIGTLTYLGIYTQIINSLTPEIFTKDKHRQAQLPRPYLSFNVINTLIFLPVFSFASQASAQDYPSRKRRNTFMGEPKHLITM
jgi:phosphate:Na+ symporter